MHYILVVALKNKLERQWEPNWKDKEKVKLTYEDIQYTMESKFKPDQVMQKQLQYLVSYGYIKQEEKDGKIYITLL